MPFKKGKNFIYKRCFFVKYLIVFVLGIFICNGLGKVILAKLWIINKLFKACRYFKHMYFMQRN
jgi:hypothetical protein